MKCTTIEGKRVCIEDKQEGQDCKEYTVGYKKKSYCVTFPASEEASAAKTRQIKIILGNAVYGEIELGKAQEMIVEKTGQENQTKSVYPILKMTRNEALPEPTGRFVQVQLWSSLQKRALENVFLSDSIDTNNVVLDIIENSKVINTYTLPQTAWKQEGGRQRRRITKKHASKTNRRQKGGYALVTLVDRRSNTTRKWYAKYLCQGYFVGYFEGEGASAGFSEHGATSKIHSSVLRNANLNIPSDSYCNLGPLDDLTNYVALPRIVGSLVDRIKARTAKRNELRQRGVVFVDEQILSSLSSQPIRSPNNYVMTLTNPQVNEGVKSVTRQEIVEYHNTWVLPLSRKDPDVAFTLSSNPEHQNAQQFIVDVLQAWNVENTSIEVRDITSALTRVIPSPSEPVKPSFSWFRKKAPVDPTPPPVPAAYLYKAQSGGFKKTAEKVTLQNKKTRCVYKGHRGVKYVRLDGKYIKLSEAKKIKP